MRYIMHIERLGWVLFLSLEDIAENSYARPTKTSLEGNIALNQLAIGMIGKKGKYNCNAKEMNAFFYALPSMEFTRVQNCKMTRGYTWRN